MLSPLEQKTTIGERTPPQVDRGAVGGTNVAGGEVVADEELVDDPLHFLGVQRDMAAPPLLEVEIALGLGVDPCSPEIVLLGPGYSPGFWFSKFCTSAAPSKMPAPRSPASAVSQEPPRRPPEQRIGYCPRTPAQ